VDRQYMINETEFLEQKSRLKRNQLLGTVGYSLGTVAFATLTIVAHNFGDPIGAVITAGVTVKSAFSVASAWIGGEAKIADLNKDFEKAREDAIQDIVLCIGVKPNLSSRKSDHPAAHQSM